MIFLYIYNSMMRYRKIVHVYKLVQTDWRITTDRITKSINRWLYHMVYDVYFRNDGDGRVGTIGSFLRPVSFAYKRWPAT